MLEAKIDALTESVKELTATIKAGGAVSSTAAKTTAPKEDKKAEPAKPSITAEQMKETALKFRDTFTPAETTALIKEVTGAGKLAEVKPADFDKLSAAMVDRLEKKKADEDI